MLTTPDRGTVTTFAASEEPQPKRPSRLYPHLGSTVAGRYHVERALGEGGMGVVYIARDLKFSSKRVALKVLKAELSDDAQVAARFFNEAQAASIGSPHIVQIFDFGTLAEEGTAYLVMELLEGRSLASVLDEVRVLPEARAVSIAKQMALGLAAAHEKGIVHRDLKPDNVQLVATPSALDFVKILDFGIAKLEGRKTKLTQVGTVFGTPHYMAPEQCAGLSVDARADIYGLGIMIFEMLAGRVPFGEGSHAAILSHHLYKAPPLLAEVAPAPVSPGICAVVQKCLTKKAEGRYSSMRELASELERIEGKQAPLALAELRARSASYDAPVDYFASRSPSPARARSPLVGIAVGAVVALAIVVSAAVGLRALASRPEASAGVVAASPASSPPPRSLPPLAVHAVSLSVTPIDAEVRRPDGALLPSVGGIATYTPKGLAETLVVSRPGYTSQALELGQGSPAIVRIDLVPAPHPPSLRAAAAKPSTAPPAAKPPAPGALHRSDCFVDGKLAPYPECRAFANP